MKRRAFIALLPLSAMAPAYAAADSFPVLRFDLLENDVLRLDSVCGYRVIEGYEYSDEEWSRGLVRRTADGALVPWQEIPVGKPVRG